MLVAMRHSARRPISRCRHYSAYVAARGRYFSKIINIVANARIPAAAAIIAYASPIIKGIVEAIRPSILGVAGHFARRHAPMRVELRVCQHVRRPGGPIELHAMRGRFAFVNSNADSGATSHRVRRRRRRAVEMPIISDKIFGELAPSCATLILSRHANISAHQAASWPSFYCARQAWRRAAPVPCRVPFATAAFPP